MDFDAGFNGVWSLREAGLADAEIRELMRRLLLVAEGRSVDLSDILVTEEQRNAFMAALMSGRSAGD